jgi:hypothetical protein
MVHGRWHRKLLKIMSSGLLKLRDDEYYDKNIKFIASGASNYKPDNGWIDWNIAVWGIWSERSIIFPVHRYTTEARQRQKLPRHHVSGL